MTLQYAACQRLGVVLGSFADYDATKQYADTKTQWMLPTLLQLLPAASYGIGTSFCPEVAPLAAVGQWSRGSGHCSLSKLRHLPVEDHVVAG